MSIFGAPQRLKPRLIWLAYGTTEVVPSRSDLRLEVVACPPCIRVGL